MNNNQKKLLAVGAGIITGVILSTPVRRRLKALHKAEMSKTEEERAAIWLAAGHVGERARAGEYATLQDALTDFEFERIRHMEEHTTRTED